MQTVAVLPVKTFARAKHRLSEAVDVPDRRELAEAMLGDVLEALGAVRGLDGVVVVTAEPRAARAARRAGAEVVHDGEEAGQSAAATLGVTAAARGGATRVLLVPGDCPALDPEEVGRLLGRDDLPGVVIVPDRHGTGTNALLLSPPHVVEPAFGPGSLTRHGARGRASGAGVTAVELPSLGLDVDTPADLAALAAHRGGAARTRELLARLLPVAAAG